MSLRRTNIYIDDAANKELLRIGKRLGLAPAQLTRLAVAQFIERENAAQKSKKGAS